MYVFIGSLEEGFDKEKKIFLLNNGALAEKECINCWNLVNCMICLASVDSKEPAIIYREDKLGRAISKAETLSRLRELCILFD